MPKAKESKLSVIGIKTDDLESKTADELEDLLRDLNNEQAERRAAIVEVHAVYDRKRETEVALAKLGNLSEGEIAAIEHVIKTDGIPSRDEVENDEG